MGAEDPSRMCTEELTDDAVLIQVKRVLLDVNMVPYVPKLFSAQNPPEPIRFRLREKISVVLEHPLKILCRDTGRCTGVIRHKPTSPDHTTFFPAPPLKQKRLNRLTICPAARQPKARSPRWRRQLKGKRTRITPPDHEWSWWKPCHQSLRVVGWCASVKRT
jgi:hypothetical protein